MNNFETWLKQCNKIVCGKLGIGLMDMPDASWRDYHDDGLTPAEAVDCAYEDYWQEMRMTIGERRLIKHGSLRHE